MREDPEVVAWWGNWVECAVAISRLKRGDGLSDEDEEKARALLDRMAGEWREVEPTDELRFLTAILSKRYPLKAADALQLAAAVTWSNGEARDEDFVCLDDRLRRAAQSEGFHVLPIEGER